MEQSEIQQRVAGLLTVSLSDDLGSDDVPDRFAPLLDGMLRANLQVPVGASPEEIAKAVMAEIEPRFNGLVAALLGAFMLLAQEHDAGQPTRSSLEVIQDLALRWAAE